MAMVQVRYIVNDVDEAIKFYTEHLGFKLEMHPAPAFAMLSRDSLRLVLSAPNPAAGGGQAMSDGPVQAPGGWNRFAIEVDDIASIAETLQKEGVHFRNDIVTGVGGKQVIMTIRGEIRSNYSSPSCRKHILIVINSTDKLFIPPIQATYRLISTLSSSFFVALS